MKFLIIFLIGNIFGFQQELLARAGNFVPTWDKLERRTAWTVDLYAYTFDCYTHVVESTWFKRDHHMDNPLKSCRINLARW